MCVLRSSLVFSLLLLFLFIATVPECTHASQVVYDQIYQESTGYHCVRIFSNNGTVGCTGGRTGNSGTLVPLTSEDDILAFVKKKEWKEYVVDGKVVVAMNHSLLRVDTLKDIEAACDGKLQGVVVMLPETAPAHGYSPASTFPNRAFGLHNDSKYQWNTYGDDLFSENLNFPLFMLDHNDSATVMNYALENEHLAKKSSGSLLEGIITGSAHSPWGADLDLFMWGSDDVSTCIERGYCSIMGGYSVWGTLQAHANSSADTVLALTSIDSDAFFHALATGAAADMSGVVAQMAAADALQRTVKYNTTFGRQIMFMFVNGESYGYMGSQHMVENIVDSGSPLHSLDQIVGIIETRQVSVTPWDEGNNTFYVHQELSTRRAVRSKRGNDDDSTTLEALEKAWYASGDTLNGVVLSTETDPKAGGIPPSSSMSFLKGNPDLDVSVLTNHYGPYTNKYYHSIYDDSDNVNRTGVCAAATLLARSLFLMAQPENVTLLPTIEADCNLVSMLMECLTESWSCPMMSNIIPGLKAPDPPSHFIAKLHSVDLTSKFIYEALPLLVVDSPLDRAEYNCSHGHSCPEGYDCFGDDFCVNATAKYVSAYSHKYDNTRHMVNSTSIFEPIFAYSKYESGSRVRLFRQEYQVVEYFVVVFGVLVLLVSIVLVYIERGRWRVHFKEA
eukprot:TRINITY_DN5907_c0_g1_i1.p1 TRINITY_DN5907_c0_g1~~TRINITY_DN5907_c0_g1_i1.p1  ORF type:complete len:673 (-),score=179.95 TRINITY_DN5907_c0_g1_i1:58-2076(-)